MKHKVDKDFYWICGNIVRENKNIEQWAELESDDMFLEGSYEGGFDATEMEFCFSVHINNVEYWFQLSLEDVKKIHSNQINEFEIRLAE